MPPAKTPASAKVPAALRRPQIGATTSVQAPATRASQKDVQATSKKTQSVDGASGVRGGRLGTKEKEGQTKTASEEGAEQEKGGKPGEGGTVVPKTVDAPETASGLAVQGQVATGGGSEEANKKVKVAGATSEPDEFDRMLVDNAESANDEPDGTVTAGDVSAEDDKGSTKGSSDDEGRQGSEKTPSIAPASSQTVGASAPPVRRKAGVAAAKKKAVPRAKTEKDKSKPTKAQQKKLDEAAKIGEALADEALRTNTYRVYHNAIVSYDAECVEIDQGNTRHQGRALDKGEELSRFEEECQKKAAAWTGDFGKNPQAFRYNPVDHPVHAIILKKGAPCDTLAEAQAIMEAFDAWVKDNITKDAQRHRLHITKESGFMVSVIDGQHSVHAGTIIKAVMPHVNTTGYAMLYSAKMSLEPDLVQYVSASRNEDPNVKVLSLVDALNECFLQVDKDGKIQPPKMESWVRFSRRNLGLDKKGSRYTNDLVRDLKSTEVCASLRTVLSVQSWAEWLNKKGTTRMSSYLHGESCATIAASLLARHAVLWAALVDALKEEEVGWRELEEKKVIAVLVQIRIPLKRLEEGGEWKMDDPMTRKEWRRLVNKALTVVYGRVTGKRQPTGYKAARSLGSDFVHTAMQAVRFDGLVACEVEDGEDKFYHTLLPPGDSVIQWLENFQIAPMLQCVLVPVLNRFGKGPVKSDRQVDERPRVPWTSATLPAEKLAEYGQRFTAGVIKCALIEDKYEKKDAEKRAKDLLEHLVPCPPLFGALGYETIMAARKRSADVKQKKALRACELDVLPEEIVVDEYFTKAIELLARSKAVEEQEKMYWITLCESSGLPHVLIEGLPAETRLEATNSSAVQERTFVEDEAQDDNESDIEPVFDGSDDVNGLAQVRRWMRLDYGFESSPDYKGEEGDDEADFDRAVAHVYSAMRRTYEKCLGTWTEANLTIAIQEAAHEEYNETMHESNRAKRKRRAENLEDSEDDTQSKKDGKKRRI